MEQLNKQQVEALLNGLNGWELGYHPHEFNQPDLIFKSVKCPTFAAGMDLAQQITTALTGNEDHIGVSIDGFREHNNLTLALRTYNEEAGPPFGVTEQDISVARCIDVILPRAA